MRRVLVILVVLVLAVCLFRWRGWNGNDPVVDQARDVNECMVQLREIHLGFVRYKKRLSDALPQRSGVAVLGALLAEGALPDTPETRAMLTCPGRHAHAVPANVDFLKLDALSSADSAYAVRDLVAYPLARFPAGGSANEALVACDNAHGLNHDGCMNVLYTDGSVKTFTLAQEIERGTLPPNAKTIPVGPDSPLNELRVLVPD